MSPSTTHRPGSRALPSALVAVLVLALIGALGCFGARHGRHHERHGFTGDTGTVQIVSAELGGKNVFIPSTIVVKAGAPVTLSIFNTTGMPHGFSIPALGITEVVPSQEEFAVELPALEGHQLLLIRCQLHPAHRTATLMVVPSGTKHDAPHPK